MPDQKNIHYLLFSCDVETFRAGGKGGQHQNKTESAVRLRHRPTGLVVVCRDERSQYLNKMRALAVLKERLRRRAEKPKPRIATKVSLGQKVRRREKKKNTGIKKQMRKKPEIEEV
jgi:protein subunit release factor A